MSDEHQQQIEREVGELKVAVTLLFELARDAYARAEALQMVLMGGGAGGNAEFDAAYASAKETWNRTIANVITKGMQERGAAEVRRILEHYKGPSH